MGFPGGSDGKEFACNVGDLGSMPLEKEMTTRSSILAWRSLWVEECTHIYIYTYIYSFQCTSFLYLGVHSQPGTFPFLSTDLL